MESKLSEYCGVFGCVAGGEETDDFDVAQVICLGLVALQHRGQESAGITTTFGGKDDEFRYHRGRGQVSNVFNDEVIVSLRGNLGIGHTRYSTAGGTDINNIQPFIIHTVHGIISIAHNGQLINADSLRRKVLERGVGLSTGSDSEVIGQMLTLPPSCGEPDGPNWPARIKNFMNISPLAYSLVIMHRDTIYALRDPFGNRPLCLGRFNGPKDEAKSWVVSSESCSFQSMGAKYWREIEPGEIVEISGGGVKSMCTVPRPSSYPPAFCIFEYVYFSRADSLLEDQMVYSVRTRCGEQLAIEAPVEADIVSTVPESATPAALGYSSKSGIPYVEVLCKNRYVGRTFIQPSERLRKVGVAKKFGVLTDNFKGKRVVLIDDSIVRGNTIGPIVNLLKQNGAKEVHIRVASPPIKHPCYMGINIPTREELIANRYNAEELANHFGADSIVYLSVNGLASAVKSGIENKGDGKSSGHCMACLTGNYPVDWYYVGTMLF